MCWLHWGDNVKIATRLRGQGMTEYVLLVGVIAFGSVLAVNQLRGSLRDAFDTALNKIQRPVVLNLVSTSASGRPTVSSSRSLLPVSAVLDASGMPAPAPTGSLDFSWSPPASRVNGASIDPTDLGYKLYYGTSPGQYVDPIDIGHVTSHRLTGLEVGKRYYFAISTYDLDGAESALSNEVSKVVTKLDLQGAS